MSRNRPRTIGVLCVGGMQVCWLACALWLLDVRTGAGQLPVAGILSGLPLAFTLLRLTPALPLTPRLSAVLAGWSIWTAVLVRLSALPAEPLAGNTWLTGLAGRLFQAEGGPTALQLTALAGAGAWMCGCRLAVIPIGFVRILSEFQFGLLILLFVFFCAALWESTLPDHGYSQQKQGKKNEHHR